MALILSKDRKATQPTKPAAKRAVDEAIRLPGLGTFAKADAVAKAARTVADTLCNDVKNDVQEIFIGQGIQLGKRPPNFNAKDEKATANIQLKTLPSGLSVEAQEALNDAAIPLRVVDEVAETFIINPQYADNATYIAKLEKALEKLGLPEDFFLHQSQKKVLPNGDATVDAIFKLRNKRGAPDRARIEALLPLVTTLAVKPATTESLENCLKDVSALITVEKEEA